MKKIIIIIAALIAAVMSGKAQNNDTIATINDLRNTNEAIVTLNKAFTTHAAMVGTGGGTQLIGGLVYIRGINRGDAQMCKTGAVIAVIGTALVAASFIPMPKSVKLDGRGLVVNLPTQKKKR